MAEPDATFEFPSLLPHLAPELVSVVPAAGSRRTRRRPPPETSPGPVDGSAGSTTKSDYRRLRSDSSERPGAKTRPIHIHHPCPYVLGPARVPRTMELGDIRRRKSRPAGEASSRARLAGWTVLRSLSCNGIESAAVATAPLGLVVRLRSRGMMPMAEPEFPQPPG